MKRLHGPLSVLVATLLCVSGLSARAQFFRDGLSQTDPEVAIQAHSASAATSGPAIAPNSPAWINGPGVVAVGSHNAYGQSTTNCFALANIVPTSNDYYVQADLQCITAAGDARIVARATTSGLSTAGSNGYYCLMYQFAAGGGANMWHLYAIGGPIAGGFAEIGTGFADAGFTAGVTKTVRIKCQGSSPTTVSADIGATTNAISGTDSHFATGYVGIANFVSPATSTTGVHWLNFQAGYLGVAAGGVSYSLLSANGVTVTAATPSGGAPPYTYKFQRSTDNTTFTDLNGGAFQSSKIYADSGLSATTLYYYRVVAKDAAAFTSTGPSASVMTASHNPSTFYVSGAASGSGNGLSSGAPFTLAQAQGVGWVVGDTILFDAANPVTGAAGGLTFSGLAGSPTLKTTIGSYGGGVATFNVGTGVGLTLTNCSYFEVANLHIIGSDVDNGSAFTTQTSTGPGIWVHLTGANSATFPHMYFTGIEIERTKKGLLIDSVSDMYSGGDGVDDLRVIGSTFHDIEWFGIRSEAGTAFHGDTTNTAVQNSPHSNFLISSCHVYNILGDNGVQSPQVVETGDGIVLFGVKGALVERCAVHNSGQTNVTNSGGGAGGIWCCESDRVVIRHCWVDHMYGGPSHQDGVGYDFDGGVTNSVVEFCIATNCEGAAFLTGGFNDTAQNSGLGVHSSTNGANTIRYSIAENCATVSQGAFHNFEANHGIIVSHCVFYGKTMFSDAANGFGYFTDNVFYVTTAGSWGTSSTQNLYLGNDYYFFPGVTFSVMGSASLSALQASTVTTASALTVNQETLDGVPLGLSADPKFLSPGGGAAQLLAAGYSIVLANGIKGLTAYDVQSTSPLIGAGVELQRYNYITDATRASVFESVYDLHGGLTHPGGLAGGLASIGASVYPNGGYSTAASAVRRRIQ